MSGALGFYAHACDWSWWCSPYPVRFAIEGKGYALLVLLVALAWWWRRRQQWLGYGLSVVLGSVHKTTQCCLFTAR